MPPRAFGPILAPASRVGSARRRAHGFVVPRGRRVYRSRQRVEVSPIRVAALIVALAAGVGCGVHYFRSGAFGATGLWLAGIALVLAASAPAWAMSLAVTEALGVPLAYGVMVSAGWPISFPPQPHAVATLLALLPTLGGAMLGLGARWTASRGSGFLLRP